MQTLSEDPHFIWYGGLCARACVYMRACVCIRTVCMHTYCVYMCTCACIHTVCMCVCMMCMYVWNLYRCQLGEASVT